MIHLKIHLLGSPYIELNGQVVNTDRQKAVALMAYLAVEDNAHSRDALAALFWPDYDTEKALAYLRRTIWEINQVLGKGYLEAVNDQVSLIRKPDLWIDLWEFRQLIGENHKTDKKESSALLGEAVELYRGEFLSGVALRDSAQFDDWLAVQQEKLRQDLGNTLDRLSKQFLIQGEIDSAIANARRWLDLDDLNESAHRRLIELYAKAGQRNAALRQYQACAQKLMDNLGISPEPATMALMEKIKAGQLTPSPAIPESRFERDTVTVTQRLPVRLPAQSTPFVGRLKELEEIERLIRDPACRVLTLLGPGGMGKTRLGIQTASHLTGDFPDGVYFVPLAPLTSTNQVSETLAVALQITFRRPEQSTEDPVDDWTQLLEYLRQRKLLLVIDNFEHLLEWAGMIPQMIEAAPNVKILATSRERLNIPEEWLLEIHGMAFPDILNRADVEEYSAVKLFLQTARRARAGFEPQEFEWKDILRICELVDGMPLGIEMAAAWVRTLTCAEIVQEIEHSLDFLSSSQKGVPERHRSLRAIFDQSWVMLSESEKSVFRRLSCFRGGFTRQAAARIAGASLGIISSLVDRSLVSFNHSGRYDMHEVLRKYAEEKLSEYPDEYQRILDWHSDYYLEYLNENAINLQSPGLVEAGKKIEIEFENIRSALMRLIECAELEKIASGFQSINLYANILGRISQGYEIFVLAAQNFRKYLNTHAKDPLAREIMAVLLNGAGTYAQSLDRYDQSGPFFTEGFQLLENLPMSPVKAAACLLGDFGQYRIPENQVLQNYQDTLAFYKSSSDQFMEAITRLTWAGTKRILGDENEVGLQAFNEALRTFESLHNPWGEAVCMQALTQLFYWKGDYRHAFEYGERALPIFLEIQNDGRAMDVRFFMAQTAVAQGDYLKARQYYRDGLEYARKMGHRYLIAVYGDCLGYVDYLENKLDEAEKWYSDSLILYRQINAGHGIGMDLTNLADIAESRGDFLKAKNLNLEGIQAMDPQYQFFGLSKAHKNLGRIAFRQGHWEEAEAEFRKSYSLAQLAQRQADIVEISVWMARLLWEKGRKKEALGLLMRALSDPAAARDVRAEGDRLMTEFAGSISAGEMVEVMAEKLDDLNSWLTQYLKKS